MDHFDDRDTFCGSDLRGFQPCGLAWWHDGWMFVTGKHLLRAEVDGITVLNIMLAHILGKCCANKFIDKRQISRLFPHWDLQLSAHNNL